MVLLEKGLDWTLVPTASSSAEHMPRYPFWKTPAVEIDGHLLIESDAICRYVDDTFGGPALVPDSPLDGRGPYGGGQSDASPRSKRDEMDVLSGQRGKCTRHRLA